MTPVEVLKAAKANIATPDKWTKGCAARGPQGNVVDPSMGTCFCALGAIWGVTSPANDPDSAGFLAEFLLEKARLILHPEFFHVPAFNDDKDTKHEEVLDLYDKAIELAERKP
jgi:hypothetical protein